MTVALPGGVIDNVFMAITQLWCLCTHVYRALTGYASVSTRIDGARPRFDESLDH
jgi:hypothetical protein